MEPAIAADRLLARHTLVQGFNPADDPSACITDLEISWVPLQHFLSLSRSLSLSLSLSLSVSLSVYLIALSLSLSVSLSFRLCALPIQGNL
jgi:hypothetical protein